MSHLDFAIGWAEIAARLGCSTRTAIRWHRRHGLPVAMEAGRAMATIVNLTVWRRLVRLPKRGRVRQPAHKAES